MRYTQKQTVTGWIEFAVFKRLSLVVLALFLTGLSLPALHEGSEFLGLELHDTHSDDGSCPDTHDDGSSCGPVCPCACCPGHGIGAPRLAPILEADLVPAFHRAYLFPYGDNLHLSELADAIFHPPRA